MQCTGEIKQVFPDWKAKRLKLTLEVDASADEIAHLMDKRLSVELKQYRDTRSKDANALLWHCLGEIANDQGVDKWDLYLNEIKKRGKYTTILIDEDAVDSMQELWRESEVVDREYIDGKPKVRMNCYYGSSTYTTKEFSQLLDSVIEDMKALELEPPTSGATMRALAKWEAEHGQHNAG